MRVCNSTAVRSTVSHACTNPMFSLVPTQPPLNCFRGPHKTNRRLACSATSRTLTRPPSTATRARSFVVTSTRLGPRDIRFLLRRRLSSSTSPRVIRPWANPNPSTTPPISTSLPPMSQATSANGPFTCSRPWGYPSNIRSMRTARASTRSTFATPRRSTWPTIS